MHAGCSVSFTAGSLSISRVCITTCALETNGIAPPCAPIWADPRHIDFTLLSSGTVFQNSSLDHGLHNNQRHSVSRSASSPSGNSPGLAVHLHHQSARETHLHPTDPTLRLTSALYDFPSSDTVPSNQTETIPSRITSARQSRAGEQEEIRLCHRLQPVSCQPHHLPNLVPWIGLVLY